MKFVGVLFVSLVWFLTCVLDWSFFLLFVWDLRFCIGVSWRSCISGWTGSVSSGCFFYLECSCLWYKEEEYTIGVSLSRSPYQNQLLSGYVLLLSGYKTWNKESSIHQIIFAKLFSSIIRTLAGWAGIRDWNIESQQKTLKHSVSKVVEKISHTCKSIYCNLFFVSIANLQFIGITTLHELMGTSSSGFTTIVVLRSIAFIANYINHWVELTFVNRLPRGGFNAKSLYTCVQAFC